jgi:hypothetical protein
MPCLRTSFASAEIRAASPTATRRPRLAQPRPPLLAHREISFRKGRNSLCDLLEIRDLQWSFGPPNKNGPVWVSTSKPSSCFIAMLNDGRVQTRVGQI